MFILNKQTEQPEEHELSIFIFENGIVEYPGNGIPSGAAYKAASSVQAESQN